MSKAELVNQLLKLYDIAYGADWIEDYEDILLDIGPDVETKTIEEYLNLMSESQLAAAYKEMKLYKDDHEYDPLKEYSRIRSARRTSEYEKGWADGFEEAYELLGHQIK